MKNDVLHSLTNNYFVLLYIIIASVKDVLLFHFVGLMVDLPLIAIIQIIFFMKIWGGV